MDEGCNMESGSKDAFDRAVAKGSTVAVQHAFGLSYPESRPLRAGAKSEDSSFRHTVNPWQIVISNLLVPSFRAQP
ncbi:hypothetical protein Z043_104571 [Scleropages formosus]|uniref:Uncharacterized protein n=1 Tax=Scleropages formosus TaxID=113540 RepID=A0A0P7V4A2_SCLFO|nr:hypothetical protein Z043_104571 [Scleropages formosus]